MTEGSIRNALSDIKLTRQAKSYLFDQMSKGKEELTKVLSAEFKKFLGQVNIPQEVQKALEGLTIKISISRRASSKK